MCAELLSGWFARGRPGSRCLSQLLTSPLIRLLMLLGGSADRILASGLPGGVGRSELLAAGNHEGLLSVQVLFWTKRLCKFRSIEPIL